jgi:hypothetical protein
VSHPLGGCLELPVGESQVPEHHRDSIRGALSLLGNELVRSRHRRNLGVGGVPLGEQAPPLVVGQQRELRDGTSRIGHRPGQQCLEMAGERGDRRLVEEIGLVFDGAAKYSIQSSVSTSKSKGEPVVTAPAGARRRQDEVAWNRGSDQCAFGWRSSTTSRTAYLVLEAPIVVPARMSKSRMSAGRSQIRTSVLANRPIGPSAHGVRLATGLRRQCRLTRVTRRATNAASRS